MIVVGISGASGPVMGIRLIEELLNSGEQVTAVISEAAGRVAEYELGLGKNGFSSLRELLGSRRIAGNYERFTECANNDFFSAVASGSVGFDAAVVMPCSMKTLASIAHGYADTLITRVCDVAFKEKRKCILIPRETPLNLIHIENLRIAARAGADIVPPVPGFYTRPETVDDIIDFVVGKVLNLLDIKHTLFKPWRENEISV